jgi:hypothetical protein
MNKGIIQSSRLKALWGRETFGTCKLECYKTEQITQLQCDNSEDRTKRTLEGQGYPCLPVLRDSRKAAVER